MNDILCYMDSGPQLKSAFLISSDSVAVYLNTAKGLSQNLNKPFSDLKRKTESTAQQKIGKKANTGKGGAKSILFCAQYGMTQGEKTSQAASVSNKAFPNLPDSILAQSLRMLNAKAMRKNCVSVFRFPHGACEKFSVKSQMSIPRQIGHCHRPD